MFIEHSEKVWDTPFRPNIFALKTGGGAAAHMLEADDPKLLEARASGQLVSEGVRAGADQDGVEVLFEFADARRPVPEPAEVKTIQDWRPTGIRE